MRHKIFFLFFLVFFLLIGSVFSLDFMETFGTGEYDYFINGTECYYDDGYPYYKFYEIITLENLDTVSSIELDNTAYCSLMVYYAPSYTTSYLNVTSTDALEGENLEFFHAASDYNGNSLSSVDFVFPYEVVITDDTVLSAYFNLYNNDNSAGCIVFRDGYGNDVVAIYTDTESIWSGCANYSQASLEYNSDIGVNPSLVHNFNSTYHDIRIMSFLSVNSNNAHYPWYLDEVQLLNHTSSNNSLPLINFSVNNTLICNQNESVVQIPLEIDAYDIEGDTIYYAMNYVDREFVTEAVYFTKEHCFLWNSPGTCSEQPDYSFLDRTYFHSDTCGIVENGIYNNTLTKIPYSHLGSVYALDLWQGCTGTNEFIYELETPLNSFFYNIDINITSGDSFNIAFYDNKFTPVSILNVYQGENTEFYSDGVFLGSVSNLGTSWYDFTGFFADITIEKFPSNLNATLYVDNGKYIFPGVQWDNTKPVYYVAIEPDNSSLLIWQFYYSGFEGSINWVTQKPNNYTFYRSGTYQIVLHTTDDYHLGLDEYDSHNLTISLLDVEYCFGEGGIQTGSDSLFEYTGSDNLLSKFLWFLQLPYRIAVEFDILLYFQIASIIAVLLIGWEIYDRNHNINGTLISIVLITILLFFMRLMHVVFGIGIIFISSLVIAKHFSQSGGTNG